MMPQYRKLTTLCYAAVLAFGLAACGGGGTETAEAPPAPDPGPDPALGVAQMAADAAADAADTAVMAQMGNQAAAPGSYAVAQREAMRAREASDAAQAATSASVAQARQKEAEQERDDAVMYADMVMDAHVEAVALMAAMTAADTAAMAAETAATATEEAAVVVTGLVGADSGQAMAADAAAMAARAAAVVARAASDAAQAADESSVAIGHQTTAETEQGKAETQLALAEELQRESQVAHDTSALQNEMRDIADGRADAKMYSDLAAGHYDSAVAKQGLARAQATAARNAADRAKASEAGLRQRQQVPRNCGRERPRTLRTRRLSWPLQRRTPRQRPT